jgi:hypothetical protein
MVGFPSSHEVLFSIQLNRGIRSYNIEHGIFELPAKHRLDIISYDESQLK